ncbi:hypothetical protein ABZ924_33270 [Streptomyces sp. NPDC046876]|uniref:hypothetical protein n=1 Tax=Streptomyces sp. NPDC046876 TaxID=3155616 RepID=UPI0033C53095
MDAALPTLLVGIAGVGGTVASGYLAQQAAQRTLRWEHERQQHENLRDCYIAVNSRARSCRYALADYVQGMATNTLTDETRQRAATAMDAHRAQYDEAQMVVSDSVLAEARNVNEMIGRLYGVLRRIDCGAPLAGDSIEWAKRLLKDLWPLLTSIREAMRLDLGVSGGTRGD